MDAIITAKEPGLRQTLSIILLLALAIFGAAHFFRGCGDSPPPLIAPTITLEKKAGDIEKEYSTRIAELTKENDSLKKEIEIRKKQLMLSRQSVNVSRQEVVRLIVKEKTVRDTILKIVYCDSLQRRVDSLLTEESAHDSLCGQQQESYARQVSVKDSALMITSRSYQDLKSVMDSSLIAQKTLADNLNAANGKLRRRGNMNRFLSGTLLVLGGIVASNFIIHH
jgi:hypothetical protein